jgi:hypothetical protein
MPIYAQFTAQPEGALRGLYHVEEGEQPDGTVPITEAQWKDLSVNQAFRRWNGRKIVTYEPPPPPAPDLRTAKADIWRRATDEETETIVAALASRPLREQRIFADAAYLDHGDPLFDALVSGFIQAFGEARTSELLAASDPA